MDEIIKALRWLAKETEFVFAAEQLNAAADAIERLGRENAELREAQRWIPVSERLPESEGTVEAYSPSFGVFDAYCDANDRNRRVWKTRGHEIRVTHWRLPEPPKGA